MRLAFLQLPSSLSPGVLYPVGKIRVGQSFFAPRSPKPSHECTHYRLGSGAYAVNRKSGVSFLQCDDGENRFFSQDDMDGLNFEGTGEWVEETPKHARADYKRWQ